MEQFVEKLELEDGTFKVAKQDGEGILWGKVDKDSNVIVPCEYEDVGEGYSLQEEGILKVSYTPVKKNGLWGILNSTFLEIPCIYEAIDFFVIVGADFAVFPIAKYKGFWGVGNPNNPIIPFVYDEIGYFKLFGKEFFRDLALVVVKYKGKYGVLKVKDEKSSNFIPFIYDSIDLHVLDPVCKTILVKKDDLWGVLDLNGNQLDPCIYEDYEYVNGAFLKLKLGGEWAFHETNLVVNESDIVSEDGEDDNKIADLVKEPVG